LKQILKKLMLVCSKDPSTSSIDDLAGADAE
jgi:hypothetical protein